MKDKIFDIINKEETRQANTIELIASENFCSESVREAMGSCLTNKYAEGYPGNRYYGGCEYVDEVERECISRFQAAFHTDYHVNVQPHSGSQANQAAYAAVLHPGDTILSLDLNSGGHLSHGSSVNFSGKIYNIVHYNLDEKGYIDMEDFLNKLHKSKPQLVLAGASAYARIIPFAEMEAHLRKFEDFYGYRPIFMVDMAHIAGLVAAGEHPTPFGYADIITTTTHKTLRGPRGGVIFCKAKFTKKVDSAVFPGSQGGPLMHVIAAKAICAQEACSPEYQEYIKQVVLNCKAMANEFIKMGYELTTGGTDNHLLLIDFSQTHPNLTGLAVQNELDKHGITLNKNCVPNEKRSPKEASGVRIGTAAMTTKGYKEADFISVAHKIDEIIKSM